MSSGFEQKCCLADNAIWVMRMRAWAVFPETNFSSTSRQTETCAENSTHTCRVMYLWPKRTVSLKSCTLRSHIVLLTAYRRANFL